MQAIDAQPLTEDELPPRTPRGAPLGKEGALVADLLKLLLKIRAREIDVAARLLARSTIWNCWPRACARICRPRRLAHRRVRPRCARSGRGQAGLCGGRRQAEDDPCR
jgi:hypothetical protein